MWRIEVVDTYHVGKFNSMTVDSSGQPHISYYDEVNGNVKYAMKSGRSWIIEVVANAGAVQGGSIAVYTSIGVDPSGVPHIVFYDDNQHQLKYATKAGVTWNSQVIDSGSALTGIFPSIAVDARGNPHVSYYGSPGGIADGFLKYAVKTGGSWSIEIADNDGDPGSDTNIALDSYGNPQIIYVRYPSLLDHTQSTLKYAIRNSGKWMAEIVDDTGKVSHGSVALDSKSNPQISYHDFKNGHLLYGTKVGRSWNIGLVDRSADVGRYNSIAVDSSNGAHLCYFDGANKDLKYAFLRAGHWTTQVVDSIGSVGSYSNISLDSSQLVHISYYDSTLYSLKYAHSD